MKDILVSVIIPVYNVEPYLKKCIESVISQDYDNLEIILIDDGSTDGSKKICDEFAAIDRRIKVLHKKNGGISQARKSGIELSTGDYVLILDGDDWLDKNTVSSCLTEVRKKPELECVMFSYTKEYENKSVPVHVFEGRKSFLDKQSFFCGVYRRIIGLSNSELRYPEKLENLTTCTMKLYKRELTLNGRYVDTDEVGSCEDGIFNLYALKNCKSGVYIDEAFYHYRKLSTSLSNRYRPNLLLQWDNLFNMMQTIIDKNNYGDECQESMNNRIALSIIFLGLNELANPDFGFLKFRKYIKNLLNRTQYQNAIKTMSIKSLPLMWKPLLFSCKMKWSFAVSVLLLIIRILK